MAAETASQIPTNWATIDSEKDEGDYDEFSWNDSPSLTQIPTEGNLQKSQENLDESKKMRVVIKEMRKEMSAMMDIRK